MDVTNYVMLETGQPLHAFDRSKLTGPIGVRRAVAGEKIDTLDDVVRTLDAEDMVVTDDTGPIALAGVMGGASTEIGPDTTDVVLEAAYWDPASVARTVRRHRLPSEAARRFERGVDPEIAGVALARCVELLVTHGGAAAGRRLHRRRRAHRAGPNRHGGQASGDGGRHADPSPGRHRPPAGRRLRRRGW